MDKRQLVSRSFHVCLSPDADSGRAERDGGGVSLVRRHFIGSRSLQTHQQLCQKHPGGGRIHCVRGETLAGSPGNRCVGLGQTGLCSPSAVRRNIVKAQMCSNDGERVWVLESSLAVTLGMWVHVKRLLATFSADQTGSRRSQQPEVGSSVL